MRTLITGGTVISMDPATGDLDPGDVLLEADMIVEVAEHNDAPEDAVVTDVTDLANRMRRQRPFAQVDVQRVQVGAFAAEVL